MSARTESHKAVCIYNYTQQPCLIKCFQTTKFLSSYCTLKKPKFLELNYLLIILVYRILHFEFDVQVTVHRDKFL